MPTLQELFDDHAGLALSQQRDLDRRIGGWDWQFSMDDGTISFTKPGPRGAGTRTIVTSCQVLGTESEVTRTWLWAWANVESGLPPDLVEASARLRSAGKQAGIAELTDRSLPIGEWDGHRLSMIAAGASRCAGYYRGPFDGGAIFVLLIGPELVSAVEKPLLRFSTVFPELVRGFEVHDHRRAARGLARGLGLTLTEGATWRVGGREGTLELAFDAQDRLSRLDASLR